MVPNMVSDPLLLKKASLEFPTLKWLMLLSTPMNVLLHRTLG